MAKGQPTGSGAIGSLRRSITAQGLEGPGCLVDDGQCRDNAGVASGVCERPRVMLRGGALGRAAWQPSRAHHP